MASETAASSAAYDSGEEFAREESMRRAASARGRAVRIIRRPQQSAGGIRHRAEGEGGFHHPPLPQQQQQQHQQNHVPPIRVAPTTVLSHPSAASPSIAPGSAPVAPVAAPVAPGSARVARRQTPVPQLMSAFPSTVFWGDKLGVLGAVHLVAEALVRSILMESEEFVDRVAWVCLERLVAGSPAPARAHALSEIRRQLGEIRATHSAFHSAADHSLVHGSILVLLRACHLALLSVEMARAPYAWALDRHVQEIVFQCDFAAMVLAKVELQDAAAAPHLSPLVEERPDAPELFLPAHYANEALLRALPLLDLRDHGDEDKRTPATCASLARLVGDHAQSVSNDWLRRNLTRVAAGLRVASTVGNALEQEEQAAGGGGAGTAALFVDAALENIMRERAQAINTWTQRQGSEMGNMFTDPLYRIEAELERRGGGGGGGGAGAAGAGGGGGGSEPLRAS